MLIEPYLPGREFTTGIVGTVARAEVLGTIEVQLLDTAEPGVYSYANKEDWRTRVHSDLPIICGKRGIPYRELIRRIVDSARARLVGGR